MWGLCLLLAENNLLTLISTEDNLLIHILDQYVALPLSFSWLSLAMKGSSDGRFYGKWTHTKLFLSTFFLNIMATECQLFGRCMFVVHCYHSAEVGLDFDYMMFSALRLFNLAFLPFLEGEKCLRTSIKGSLCCALRLRSSSYFLLNSSL